MRRTPSTQSDLGFTLVEAVIAVAVLALLISAALPPLRELLLSQRQTAQLNGLVGALHLTRSEAIKRGIPMVFCPSSDGDQCDQTTTWEHGIILFPDPNGNRQRDPDEPLVWRMNPLPAGTTLRTGARIRIVYQPLGTAGGYNDTFTMCDSRGDSGARAVILSITGRPRIADTRSDGSSLSCP